MSDVTGRGILMESVTRFAAVCQARLATNTIARTQTYLQLDQAYEHNTRSGEHRHEHEHPPHPNTNTNTTRAHTHTQRCSAAEVYIMKITLYHESITTSHQ